MQVHQNYQLKKYNTFGIDATAKYFATFSSIDEFQEILDHPGAVTSNRKLILGGGSNILFVQDFNGIILKNNIRGISISAEDDEYVYVNAAAGENWHELVTYCVERNFGGIENLSLIPGNTGAAPMQNIGAYGVELADVFYDLRAFHIHDKKIIKFFAADCAFGYRDSVFKKKYKEQFAILDITLRLSKKPLLNISYAALQNELEKIDVSELTVKIISQTVINIRKSKLPDPGQIGNAGSFFKNPEIPAEKHEELLSKFPGIVSYPLPNGNSKLAAAWLIEQCGYKGFRRGDAGCHEKQALVLVNYGNATGKELYRLSEEILLSVLKKFNVQLEREVNIIN